MKFLGFLALLSMAPLSQASELIPPTLRQDTTTEANDDALSLVTDAAEPERRGFMEIGFRGRHMSIPDSLMDLWYFNDSDSGLDQPRPKVRAYSVGLEYVIKSRPQDDDIGSSNGIFYFDWMANLTKDGYWDDAEDPPNHLDGDYVVPSKDLGLLVLGADYGYEIHMVRTSQTKGNFGLSLVVGAGIGVAVLLGELEYWGFDNGVPAYTRYANDDPSDGLKRIPKVLPMLDVNLGLRFNIADRFVMRFEGGFHDMFFLGGTAGIMF
jgi:hypothetical protein